MSNIDIDPPPSRYETERRVRHAELQAASNDKRLDANAPKREDVGRAALIVFKKLENRLPDDPDVRKLRASIISTLAEVGFNRDEAVRVLDDFLDTKRNPLSYWKASRKHFVEAHGRKKRQSRSAADT